MTLSDSQLIELLKQRHTDRTKASDMALAEDGVRPCNLRLMFVSWYKYWLDGNDDWWGI